MAITTFPFQLSARKREDVLSVRAGPGIKNILSVQTIMTQNRYLTTWRCEGTGNVVFILRGAVVLPAKSSSLEQKMMGNLAVFKLVDTQTACA